MSDNIEERIGELKASGDHDQEYLDILLNSYLETEEPEETAEKLIAAMKGKNKKDAEDKEN